MTNFLLTASLQQALSVFVARDQPSFLQGLIINHGNWGKSGARACETTVFADSAS
jgi:hypothetical protein